MSERGRQVNECWCGHPERHDEWTALGHALLAWPFPQLVRWLDRQLRRLYWEAILTRDGEAIARWTSEIPGRTGPADKRWWQWPLMARRGWRVRLRSRL